MQQQYDYVQSDSTQHTVSPHYFIINLVRWQHYEDKGLGTNLPPMTRNILTIAGRFTGAAGEGGAKTELHV
jgi:hypothetical protein